mmetsp:Transcript_4585/g.15811  ORF Transcript_4585/g.15811 Transcript_4585/m.15811 type:complete len:292 (+) Transcript_4585:290-1165(+)
MPRAIHIFIQYFNKTRRTLTRRWVGGAGENERDCVACPGAALGGLHPRRQLFCFSYFEFLPGGPPPVLMLALSAAFASACCSTNFARRCSILASLASSWPSLASSPAPSLPLPPLPPPPPPPPLVKLCADSAAASPAPGALASHGRRTPPTPSVAVLPTSPTPSGLTSVPSSRPSVSSPSKSSSLPLCSLRASAACDARRFCCCFAALSASSSCWIRYTSTKLLPMRVMGSAMTTIPASIAKTPMSLPASVTGNISPYPTVVIVTMHQYIAIGMLSKANSGPRVTSFPFSA